MFSSVEGLKKWWRGIFGDENVAEGKNENGGGGFLLQTEHLGRPKQ